MLPLLPGTTKDGQKIGANWQLVGEAIDGAEVHEVKHVPGGHGIITEVYRPEWDPTGLPVVQVYQSRLYPGVVGAWSCHLKGYDRIFVNQGNLKFVLYDAREESPTFRKLAEYYVGDARPTLIVIPPGVWHGLQNLGASEALLLNMPSVAYNYDDPDHYRLPSTTDQIPYRWD